MAVRVLTVGLLIGVVVVFAWTIVLTSTRGDWGEHFTLRGTWKTTGR
jgi:hypothetical protein